MAIDIQTTAHSPMTAATSLKRPLAFAISCFLVWGFAYGLLDVLLSLATVGYLVGRFTSTALLLRITPARFWPVLVPGPSCSAGGRPA